MGGSAYIQGETYLHHVTAPQEIQTTELAKIFAKPVSSKKIGEVEVSWGHKPGSATFSVYGTGADEDSVQCYDHQHNFYNLPLRLTSGGGDVAKISEGESINVDGFSTPAQAVANGGGKATQQSSLPSSPREVVKQSPNTLLPNNRLLVTATGALKQASAQVEKFGSFAKEQLAAPRAAVQSLIPSPGQSTVDLQAAGDSEMA